VARWLFKSEPESYSFADLARDKRTSWDGVNNALAKKHLRAVRVGDSVVFYETGKVKAVVGEMKVVSPPNEIDGELTVEVEAVAALARPVTLERIKADAALADWELVKLPRLSVMPATEAQWRRIQELGRLER
jgi:predicted RNA-binding protein with PUA-like domain